MTRLRLPWAAITALAVVPVLTLAAGTVQTSGTPVSEAAAPAAPQDVTVHWSEADGVAAGTAVTATTSTTLYKFASFVGGKPVRWDPCRTIYWKFRTTGAPTGARTVVRAAVNRIAYLTGTRWVETTATTATPTSSWLPTSLSGVKPVLIGWTDATRSDLLRNRPASTLGVARTAYFGASVGGVQLAATKAAVIALDRTDRLPLTGSVSWTTVLLHELAHSMGLTHVTASSQLMYPVLGRGLRDLQSGDRAGLYRLGKAAGCINLGF